MVEDARLCFSGIRRGMSEIDAIARALSDTIATRHGYAGDQATFDDPQNGDLIRVIDRRRHPHQARTILSTRLFGFTVHARG